MWSSSHFVANDGDFVMSPNLHRQHPIVAITASQPSFATASCLMCILLNGRVAKWLEHLTAEQNIEGSSRILGSLLACSLTAHLAANGNLVATLGKLKAARKGTGHPTSLCRRLRISVLSIRHSPNVRNRIWD